MDDVNQEKQNQEKQNNDKPRKNIPYSLIVFGVAIILILVGILVLPKYRNQYRTFDEILSSGQPLDLLHKHLQKKGKVLVVGNKRLLNLSARGTEFSYEDEYQDIKNALTGKNEDALVRAMRAHGFNYLLVSTDFTNRELLPIVNIKNRLSMFSPMESFHPLVLTAACGLYEIKDIFTVSDHAGEELVTLARSVIEGREIPESNFSEEVRKNINGGIEVSVAILGLKAEETPNDRYANVKRRDYYIAKKEESLYKAVVAAARRLRERWGEKGFQQREGNLEEAMRRLWVEVEIMHDHTDVENRRGDLTPAEYSDFLWRSIELGINGICVFRGNDDKYKYLLPSSAIYWDRKTVEDFLGRLSRITGRNKNDYTTASNFHLQRFRTHHFRELENGSYVRRLRRSFPPVDESVITREGFVTALRWSNRWLSEHVKEDGRFDYKYFSTRDIFLEEMSSDDDKYNIVRHALACYSLFMIQEFIPDDQQLIDSSHQCLQLLINNTVFGNEWFDNPRMRARLPAGLQRKPFGPPLDNGREDGVGPTDFWESHDGYRRAIPGNIAYVRWDDGSDNVKMGTVGGTILAISEYITLDPTQFERYRPYLEALGEMILFMQKPNGAFNMYFVPPGHKYYSVENTIYPGEIMFGLSRLYKLLNDRRFLDSYLKAHEFYQQWYHREVLLKEPDGTYNEKRRVDLVQFVPWLAMANNDLMTVLIGKGERNNPKFRELGEFGIEVSNWIIDTYQFTDERAFFPEYLGAYYKIPTELPAMHTCVYTEGVAASYHMALLLNDEPNIRKLLRATQLGCRFGVQQLFISDMSSAPILLRNNQFLPSQRAMERSRGGARYALNLNKLRTDYTYHTLSAIAQALRYFRDSDWIQNDRPATDNQQGSSINFNIRQDEPPPVPPVNSQNSNNTQTADQ